MAVPGSYSPHAGGVYQQQHDAPAPMGRGGGVVSPVTSPERAGVVCDRARAVDLCDPVYGQSGCMVLSEAGREGRSRAFTRGCWLGFCCDLNGFFCVVSECCGLCRGKLDNRYTLAGYKYGCGLGGIIAGFLMFVAAVLSAPFVSLEVCPDEINHVHTHWVNQGCVEGGAYTVTCTKTEDKCCAAPFLAGHRRWVGAENGAGNAEGWWDCQQALTVTQCQARHNFIRNGTGDADGTVNPSWPLRDVRHRKRDPNQWSMRCTWRNDKCINDCDIWWNPVWYWVMTGVACGVCFIPMCIGGYCMYRAGQQEEQVYDIVHSLGKC